MNTNDAIAGLLVGIIVGLTGMGGSSLMAPILIYVFHFKAKFAVGSDLTYAGIAKIFGSFQHKRAGHVNLRLVWSLALGSVPASLVGVALLHYLDKANGKATEVLITKLIGAMIILIAVLLLSRTIPAVDDYFVLRQKRHTDPPLYVAILIGAVGGFLVGLTSIGAGVLFGVALILVFGLETKEMVGTDIFHGCVLALVAASGHIWAGDVDFALVTSLLIGAIPGILIGGLLSTKMPERAMRPTLGTVLLLTGLRIFI